jgi:hypothetical protein
MQILTTLKRMYVLLRVHKLSYKEEKSHRDYCHAPERKKNSAFSLTFFCFLKHNRVEKEWVNTLAVNQKESKT